MDLEKIGQLKNYLRIGIGELSEMTGVSARQLRYWETKGYIQSVPQKDRTARQYTLNTYYGVVAIKHYLDEGYTLQKAVQKATVWKNKAKLVHKFVAQEVMDVTNFDLEQEYGEIDLGYLDEAKTQKLSWICDGQGGHYQIHS
ncbi:MerR family transcriptional regulator [Ligilactobacillus ceti]|uniref:HTH merR-type domain-containing protein n=1 Tax=Ligilactobacillus ceti DSM 22408 TaxID=1122146 RepID=A0A0R2KNL9_9LACO|nr:MerR family transcriptional regulator [Ligilactobacillus ceti]KRN89286.1 hypothetical protein IV53_GL000002 [Ligilactobacillus ceti DSM 22408]